MLLSFSFDFLRLRKSRNDYWDEHTSTVMSYTCRISNCQTISLEIHFICAIQIQDCHRPQLIYAHKPKQLDQYRQDLATEDESLKSNYFMDRIWIHFMVSGVYMLVNALYLENLKKDPPPIVFSKTFHSRSFCAAFKSGSDEYLKKKKNVIKNKGSYSFKMAIVAVFVSYNNSFWAA